MTIQELYDMELNECERNIVHHFSQMIQRVPGGLIYHTYYRLGITDATTAASSTFVPLQFSQLPHD